MGSTTPTETPRAPDAVGIRLNLLLARLGIASRRACDHLIAAGRVRVGGRVVRELGTRVRVGVDVVEVDGTVVGKPPKRVVLLMHKPRGIVSTATDPEGRPTVLDLCRRLGHKQRLFPVGRLDFNTTGALLMTNDGLLCYRLTHPRFGVTRVYHVRVRGRVDDAVARRLERAARGDRAPRERTRGRVGVDVLARLPKETVLKVTLQEGRHRQVRKMVEAVGLRVVTLKRVSFGPVSVRRLPPGSVRPLERRELERLEAAAEGERRGTR
jgi:23S rRNA pseudouridine2605 synthase